ncbi:MAG TPA: U32 family peptidase [Bryobacteraceae bacterium]|nr:U32 family peptidase [Bryobacteraceae bacterium]
MIKPEIMSPAGYWPQLRAAIEAGADAVYFGLTHFTARAKTGFSLAELPEALRTLHCRGVKGYITFNSLIFDSELADAARALGAIAEAGTDAIIVQDLAALKLARQIAPALPLHGSTQMSITNADGIRMAQDLGVTRVVLARELSLAGVRAIRARTDCELEMFVHGALCVSYSGQCFSSEAWGGRSANRGQCAQACRLPYELIVDGAPRPLAGARYLLSPGDLYALRQIPEIVEIGVSALKIEGRYKDADYVALTTQAYRKAVDEACAGCVPDINRAAELQLEQVYSRGLGPHFLTGTNHQAVVRGRAPRHRGVCMGGVVALSEGAVILEPSPEHSISPLKPGDGVVFDAADWRSPQEPEEGGRIYQVALLASGKLELRFGNGAIHAERIRPGDLLWRTHDPDLDKAVRPFTTAAAPLRRQPVDVRVTAKPGAPLTAEWHLVNDPRVQATVTTPEPLASAQNRSLTLEFLREQLGRLGNTPYELASVELSIDGAPFAPASLLNQLRREAVSQLAAQQSAALRRAVVDPAFTLTKLAPQPAPSSPGAPKLHLLIRAPEQLEAALALRPATLTLDYLDLYGLRPSLERVRAAAVQARVAAPRLLKPGEERIADFLVQCGCPILVRSGGLLQALRGKPHPPLVGDFSLNAANAITAAALLEMGLTRLTPTHDLNAAQVTALAAGIGAELIEVVAFQHLPVFHTEHCVFCRFLSTGTSYRDCGRPCEHHRVALRDDAGRAHPVVADVGCRNTVFGAEAQEASAHLADWLAAGIRHFRLEFVHESPAELTRIARAFEEVLDSGRGFTELTEQLRQFAPEGTTQGSLFVPETALPVLQ